jgi:hypothetical protein
MHSSSILLTNLLHVVYIFTGSPEPHLEALKNFLTHFEWLYIFRFPANTDDDDLFNNLLVLHEQDETLNKVVPFVPEVFIEQYLSPVPRRIWGPKMWSLLHEFSKQEGTTPVMVDLLLQTLTILLPCSKCKRGLSQWLVSNPVCGAHPDRHIINLHNHVNRKLHKQLHFIF